MKLSEFDYPLPDELIAQYPLTRREKAKLLVVDRKKSAVMHDHFEHIVDYLPDHACLVLNESKVIAARLLGVREKSEGQVEIFLLKALADGTYEALLRPLRRLKEGEKIRFTSGLTAQLINKEKRIVRFNRKDIGQKLDAVGHIPLPPYIRRPDEALDKEYYQTVYARSKGSVASPTAGLHFTRSLLSKIKKKGIKIEKVTLHINYGTFKPIEVADITLHKMHEEEYRVSPAAFQRILKYKHEGRKIIAVGTTSTRVLETVALRKKYRGVTNLFIYPGFEFRMVDHLITNFHQPFSSLLMLVYAFGTTELMRRAYQTAIEERYRFLSYGDGMLIL